MRLATTASGSDAAAAAAAIRKSITGGTAAAAAAPGPSAGPGSGAAAAPPRQSIRLSVYGVDACSAHVSVELMAALSDELTSLTESVMASLCARNPLIQLTEYDLSVMAIGASLATSSSATPAEKHKAAEERSRVFTGTLPATVHDAFLYVGEAAASLLLLLLCCYARPATTLLLRDASYYYY